MIKYIKNFLRFIPTWFICVFIFFWIYKWTFIIGIMLIVIQIMQVKNMEKKIVDYESLLNDYDKLLKKYDEIKIEQQRINGVDTETLCEKLEINCEDVRKKDDDNELKERNYEIKEMSKNQQEDISCNEKNAKHDIDNKLEKQYVYQLPPLNLLAQGKSDYNNENELKEMASRLEQLLKSFGVYCTIIQITQSPLAIRFELQPEMGTRINKIKKLSDDISLNFAVKNVRIEAPIPGKAAIAIEIPNEKRSIVALRDLLESREFSSFPSSLAFAVGKDVSGKIVVADIALMPHLLIAGTTGSGKSVFIDSMIMSILYKAHPNDVKMIMIDSKGITLNAYNGIPHLLIPVVTDIKKAAAAIHWSIAEMNDRYKKFADFGVKHLKEYNEKIELLKLEDSYDNVQKLPQILIIIDDLSDLMAINREETEKSIVNLAQMSRAAGMHIVVSTQRPSTDVITGLIKVNIPSRIAFNVFSAIDSRVILDERGAEELSGNGDMLFKPLGYPRPVHIQGAYVSDKEIAKVVELLSVQFRDLKSYFDLTDNVSNNIEAKSYDEYFIEAAQIIIRQNKASIGMLQRSFKIGFNRAARIMDELYEAGVVGEEEGTKPRKVLMTMKEFEQYIENTL